MENQSSPEAIDQKRIVNRLGFYSSLVAFLAAAGYSIVQILQIIGAIKFPLDAILIYGFSFGIASPFVIAIVAFHHLLPSSRRVWSHLAIVFAIMYATYVNLNYVVQLATVIPSYGQGTQNDIRVLDQTPHSLFWDVDALGYICMGISTFFLSYALSKEQKWLRGFLFANGLMVPVISIVYFYPHFSTALLLLGSPWVVTVPGSLLFLCLYFRSELKTHVG